MKDFNKGVTTQPQIGYDKAYQDKPVYTFGGDVTMTPANTSPEVEETIPNNVIKYTASEKISDPNMSVEILSHTFENGEGTIEFSKDITSIAMYSFAGRSRLTSVTIPNSVTSIGSGAFQGCSGLTSITLLATTAPNITDSTFQNIPQNGTLYVPTGYTGYDTWLTKLPSGWTIVEQ